MEKIKYRDLIMQYLTALEPDQTITTEQVAEYVAERLLLDTAMVKKTVNVNMARLETRPIRFNADWQYPLLLYITYEMCYLPFLY